MPSIINDQDSPFYDKNNTMPEDRYDTRSADTSSFTSFDIAVDSLSIPIVILLVMTSMVVGRSNDSSYNLSEHSRGLIYFCSLDTRLVNVTQFITV